ncbi:iron chaperone [Staphylococcus simulans]|uniref:iron chaperone n=1 Tax=Staphylococcus simulans TaxID=1286 RepID=UPI00399B5C0F
MENFNDYLNKVEDPKQKEILTNVFNWVDETFPELEKVIKWNQPMYTHHGTYIIGFSRAKAHFSINPEAAGMKPFIARFDKNGYTYTENLFRIKWTQDVDYDLLKDMIQYNLEDKAEITSFWRHYK